MPSPPTLALFVGVTLLMLVVPGPSVLFAFTCGLQRGRRAAIFAVLGLETGLLIHVVAASLGISGMVASSPAGLALLKFGGAAYLAVLGLRQLMGSPLPEETREAPVSHRGSARIFSDGVLIDLLNPKTLLFFLALLPQFVEPSRGAVAGQALALGLLVVGLACACDATYALMADALGRRPTSVRLDRILSHASGAGFLLLAALATIA